MLLLRGWDKEDDPLLKPKKEDTNIRPVDTQQHIGTIIGNLYQMWINYMQQLLHAMARANKDTRAIGTDTGAPQLRIPYASHISTCGHVCHRNTMSITSSLGQIQDV